MDLNSSDSSEDEFYEKMKMQVRIYNIKKSYHIWKKKIGVNV